VLNYFDFTHLDICCLHPKQFVFKEEKIFGWIDVKTISKLNVSIAD